MNLRWVNAILTYSHHSKLTLLLPTEALVKKITSEQSQTSENIYLCTVVFLLKIIKKIQKDPNLILIYSI